MEDAIREHVRNIESNATFLTGQVKGLDIIYEQLLNCGKDDDPFGALSLLEVCIKELRDLSEKIKEDVHCIIQKQAA